MRENHTPRRAPRVGEAKQLRGQKSHLLNAEPRLLALDLSHEHTHTEREREMRKSVAQPGRTFFGREDEERSDLKAI